MQRTCKATVIDSTGVIGKHLLIPTEEKPSSYPIACPYTTNNVIGLLCVGMFFTLQLAGFYCNPQLSQSISPEHI